MLFIFTSYFAKNEGSTFSLHKLIYYHSKIQNQKFSYLGVSPKSFLHCSYAAHSRMMLTVKETLKYPILFSVNDVTTKIALYNLYFTEMFSKCFFKIRFKACIFGTKLEHLQCL